MNYIKKNFDKIALAVFTFALPIASFAQTQPGGINPPAGGVNPVTGGINPPSAATPTTTIVNPIGAKDINTLIHDILNGAIKIGIPIIALAIIYSGFLFVSAQGNPEKLDGAKRTLLYTLIGAAILLGSWTIAQLIQSTVISLKS